MFFDKTKARIEGLKKTPQTYVIWEEFIQAGKNLMFDFIWKICQKRIYCVSDMTKINSSGTSLEVKKVIAQWENKVPCVLGHIDLGSWYDRQGKEITLNQTSLMPLCTPYTCAVILFPGKFESDHQEYDIILVRGPRTKLNISKDTQGSSQATLLLVPLLRRGFSREVCLL